MMTFGCGCREISRTPIEFKIQECPQVHINCGPLLPNTNDEDFDILQNKIICDFKKVIKQLECGIQPDIEIILEEISLLFMNGCGYNVTKKMYSTDIEDDYFLRHNNFLSEFSTQEEKDQVLLNLGIYEKIKNMITKDEFTSGLNTKIGFVIPWEGKWYLGFATEEHYIQWLETSDDNLIIGKWMAGDYVPVTYTIVFNTLEGDPLDNIHIYEGFSFEFPEPTWNSDSTQHFAGWYTNEEYTGNVYYAGDKIIPKGSTIFYAKWVKDPRTVTLYPNYGSNVPIIINCYQGDKIDLITTTREGYTFQNWNTESNGSGINYSIEHKLEVNDNITLYAQWQINTYTITFDFNYRNDPNTPSNESVTVNYGTTINNNIFPQSDYVTNDGKIIKEWNINQNGNGNNPTSVKQNITFYAQWEYGYKYKLVTSIPEIEPNWDITNTQQTILGELNGWNNWMNQNNQYIIVPKQAGKSIISDYIDVLDQFNQSILEDFEIVDSNVENIIVIKQDGFSPLDDSDYNGKLIIKL